MLDEYNQFYTSKFTRKVEGQAKRRDKKAKKVVNFGQFKAELDGMLFGFNILLQNVAPHEMIEIVGELMQCKMFAPMGVYCITHLQHIIKYDQLASLD
jgi:hypothetical protein